MKMEIRRGERLLFIGDSITDAFRKPEELNPAFQLGNGHVFLIASRLWLDRPADGLQFANRGISGNRLHQVAARWETDVLAWEPTFITLLIGVNDTLSYTAKREGQNGNGGEASPLTDARAGASAQEKAQFGAGLLRLIQETRARLPGVRFLVMEPFLLPAGNITPVQIADVRQRAAVAREICQEAEVPFLPLQAELDEACRRAPAEFWCYDGIHLTAAGFALAANEWLAVTA